MPDNPLAYSLFAIGTAGSVFDFSPDAWLAAGALGFAWLLFAIVKESWNR